MNPSPPLITRLSDTEFSAELTLGRTTAHLRLAGEIDVAAAAELTRLLESRYLLLMTIHVDMADVTFLDTSGVRPLIEVTRRHRDQHLPPVVIGECSSRARYLLDAVHIGGRPTLDVDAWDRVRPPHDTGESHHFS